jgi:hypothetical protein
MYNDPRTCRRENETRLFRFRSISTDHPEAPHSILHRSFLLLSNLTSYQRRHVVHKPIRGRNPHRKHSDLHTYPVEDYEEGNRQNGSVYLLSQQRPLCSV